MCVVLVDDAAAAPHIVNANARQKTKKPNLLAYLDVVIILFFTPFFQISFYYLDLRLACLH
jgi:hypothetical protein